MIQETQEQGVPSELRHGIGWLWFLCSTILPSCPAAPAKFPSAQAESGRQWNIRNSSQQNPVSAHFGHPVDWWVITLAWHGLPPEEGGSWGKSASAASRTSALPFELSRPYNIPGFHLTVHYELYCATWLTDWHLCFYPPPLLLLSGDRKTDEKAGKRWMKAKSWAGANAILLWGCEVNKPYFPSCVMAVSLNGLCSIQ